MLPSLLSQGLMKGSAVYVRLKKGYYGLVTILLLLAYMALGRIKNPEQLKTCKPGELGKILGLDRVPETKCLRSKIQQIVSRNQAETFNRLLANDWIKDDHTFYFYIDGHVRVYHGNQARLGKKYVAREKLCLAGTSEFWVNNEMGLPYLVVTGELNEKLKEIILDKIIPVLLEETSDIVCEEKLREDPACPRLTLVFDREAYEPKFFKILWDSYRIAVITYRKNVKDQWDEKEFETHKTQVIGKEVVMKIAESRVTLSGVKLREIRKLSDNGHQTSILTTDEQLCIKTVAGKMFSRWSQENFFRYMKQDYDLDRLVEYGVEAIDPVKKLVNPSYKKLSYELKKLREKQNRLKAKFYQIIEKNLTADIDTMKKDLQNEAELLEGIEMYQIKIDEKLKERKQAPYYIQVKDMPEDQRFNKLKTESKLFINSIKMIAYRAETAVANSIAPAYGRAEDEIRMLVKEIIKSDADLIPDYQSKTLTVRLHSLSTPRANRTAAELCAVLNDTETCYPETDLKMAYTTV